MSSTNKTLLGLNLWEASDKPVRQDFVNDNTIIDDKITKINSNLDNVNSNLDNVNSNLSDVKGKAPTDLTYIMAFIPRIVDFISTGQSANMLNDITYIINTKGILSGAFGFSNRLYTDKPAGASNWGYVEYFKHADSYVTVKFYSESNIDIFIGRFILGESTWSQPWKKVQYST